MTAREAKTRCPSRQHRGAADPPWVPGLIVMGLLALVALAILAGWVL